MRQKTQAPDWSDGAINKPTVNIYAPFSAPVDDATILPFGIHKGKKMIDIPASWFIWYKEDATGIKNKWLLEYIGENWSALIKEGK